MYSLTPSLDSRDASAHLAVLCPAAINPSHFSTSIRRLQECFRIYASTCPAPLIAPGLIVTPEIRQQSELYLPMAGIAGIFERLYRAALNYPPILSSSPFYSALSWADVVAGFPPKFRFSSNPALVLEGLLSSRERLTQFLLASFLPGRFYGGFDRYPGQGMFIRQWLSARNRARLRCLDAACGTGENSYGLAALLCEEGQAAEEVRIEGWTIEPLEVWAAAHAGFPHDRQRELRFRAEVLPLFQRGYDASLRFSCVDLMHAPEAEPFDLILCNGLLGGPIVNQTPALERIVSNLTHLLAPGGVLLAADSFHGGWKQKCPQQMLRALFEAKGLRVCEAGEGLAGSKECFQP